MTPSPIALQNDTFRRGFRDIAQRRTGHWLLTPGVASLEETLKHKAIELVCSFDAFTPANDPYAEHDFGAFDLAGEQLFWKIDYYAKNDLDHGSEDPADPAKTTRVLTIMLASEY